MVEGNETPVKVWLPLQTKNLIEKHFRIEIVFSLKTLSEHAYDEHVEMIFQREDGLWHLEKYNNSFI